MATTSAEPVDVGENGVRPRPRKPLPHDRNVDANKVSKPDSGGLEVSSGPSTPTPSDAPPSVKSLSSARVEQRRRIFPTIEFSSRVSPFHPNSDCQDFRGFFNLFWIALGVMAFIAMLRNIKDTGYPLRVQIWGLFTVKLWHLAIADFLMVATTAVALPMQKLFRLAPARGAMTWAKGGMAITSLFEVGWLSVWIAVPFLLDWPWTSQVFLLLHTMALLMKVHSYSFYNGHLSETERLLRSLDDPKTAMRDPVYLYPTPENPEGKVISPMKRVKGQGTAHLDSDELSELREDLARELTSPMGNVTYPRNLTMANYLDYLLCPTLCYELEYPRTEAIDWADVVNRIVAVFGCIFLLTVISEESILPILQAGSARLAAPGAGHVDKMLTLAETISWLLFPFMLTFLLVFFVIFEYILGAFAALTRFADRHFYSDWWNSTDWMEFSREWNMPVHSFLRRHVYSASRPHLGRSYATLITFLISAVGHEIVLACITKKLRGYGLVCQMLQLPIVVIQRMRWIRGRKTLNNVFFWCSLMLGPSMMCSLYVLM